MHDSHSTDLTVYYDCICSAVKYGITIYIYTSQYGWLPHKVGVKRAFAGVCESLTTSEAHMMCKKAGKNGVTWLGNTYTLPGDMMHMLSIERLLALLIWKALGHDILQGYLMNQWRTWTIVCNYFRISQERVIFQLCNDILIVWQNTVS